MNSKEKLIDTLGHIIFRLEYNTILLANNTVYKETVKDEIFKEIDLLKELKCQLFIEEGIIDKRIRDITEAVDANTLAIQGIRNSL